MFTVKDGKNIAVPCRDVLLRPSEGIWFRPTFIYSAAGQQGLTSNQPFNSETGTLHGFKPLRTFACKRLWCGFEFCGRQCRRTQCGEGLSDCNQMTEKHCNVNGQISLVPNNAKCCRCQCFYKQNYGGNYKIFQVKGHMQFYTFNQWSAH